MGKELESVFNFISKHAWLKNPTSIVFIAAGVVGVLILTGILERVVFEASKRGKTFKHLKTGIIAAAALVGLVAGILASGRMSSLAGPIVLVASLIIGLFTAVLVFNVLAILYLIGAGVERLITLFSERQ